MKKNLPIIVLLLLLFMYHNVDAASSCSYKEQADLNSEVAKIKVVYEGKTEALDDSLFSCDGGGNECAVYRHYFTISILNMSENFYIEASNDVTKERKTFRYSDVKDGVISFNYDNASEITNFTFKVYSSDKTNCKDENYRVIYFTTPKLNPYYEYSLCANNPEHYLCQQYITTEEANFEDFYTQIQKYEKEKEQSNNEKEHRNFLEKIFDFVDDHKPLMIITTLVVVGGVAAVVIIKKRKEIL